MIPQQPIVQTIAKHATVKSISASTILISMETVYTMTFRVFGNM
ncbi:hypothetical protein EBGED10_28830 [Bacillus sp. GeD10]|nr:hypothetical protein EBGED10_28830 [Bacillus sp. GeD10]